MWWFGVVWKSFVVVCGGLWWFGGGLGCFNGLIFALPVVSSKHQTERVLQKRTERS